MALSVSPPSSPARFAASGMAAIGAIATMLKAGDHVVVSDNTYGGIVPPLLSSVARISCASATSTLGPDAVERAMIMNTKLLFVEMPTNPLMCSPDLSGAPTWRTRNNALVVDNTFASPYLQRPSSSARSVTHSTTS